MTIVRDIRNITPRSNKTRPVGMISRIARHHSASTSGDWEHFWNYWKNTKKWGTGGYHEIILRDGSVQLCYGPEEITNGVGNHNYTTYHICVVGNGSFTAAQEKTWEERCIFNMKRFGLQTQDVLGHREFEGANTACPGIDMGMVRSRLKYLLSNKPVETILGYLKKGDTGSQVKEMQNLLIKIGYKIQADSSFGPATDAAVRNYQLVSGLVVDGQYGPATKLKLETEVSKISVKPVAKPAEPKKELKLLDKLVVLGSRDDLPAAEVVAKREKAPMILGYKPEHGEIAKELILVGADKEGLMAAKITDLSGDNRFDTVANVSKYLKG